MIDSTSCIVGGGVRYESTTAAHSSATIASTSCSTIVTSRLHTTEQMASVMHAVDDVAHVTAPAAVVMAYIATASHGFHSSLHRTTRPQSTTVAIKR